MFAAYMAHRQGKRLLQSGERHRARMPRQRTAACAQHGGESGGQMRRRRSGVASSSSFPRTVTRRPKVRCGNVTQAAVTSAASAVQRESAAPAAGEYAHHMPVLPVCSGGRTRAKNAAAAMPRWRQVRDAFIIARR